MEPGDTGQWPVAWAFSRIWVKHGFFFDKIKTLFEKVSEG